MSALSPTTEILASTRRQGLLLAGLGAVGFSGKAIIVRPIGNMAVPAPVLWLSILNATLCTFAPVVMVMMAIERIGASLTAQAGTIGPLSTILMAVILLGEPFTAWVAAGTVLVLAGIWLLTKVQANTIADVSQ